MSADIKKREDFEKIAKSKLKGQETLLAELEKTPIIDNVYLAAARKLGYTLQSY